MRLLVDISFYNLIMQLNFPSLSLIPISSLLRPLYSPCPNPQPPSKPWSSMQMAQAQGNRSACGLWQNLHPSLHNPPSLWRGHGLLQLRQSNVCDEAPGDGRAVLHRVARGQRPGDVRAAILWQSHRVRVRGPRGGPEEQSSGFGSESSAELWLSLLVHGQGGRGWHVPVRLRCLQHGHELWRTEEGRTIVCDKRSKVSSLKVICGCWHRFQFNCVFRRCINRSQCTMPRCEYGAYILHQGRCPKLKEKIQNALTGHWKVELLY